MHQSRRQYKHSVRHKRHKTKINGEVYPSHYVKKIQPLEGEIASHRRLFADFAINESLKTNIKLKGYQSPTPIQEKVIPPILAGKDVIGLANTGTGKTAAFLIPLIDKILNDRTEKVLIIVPTRELAQQTKDECTAFCRHLKIASVVCIGGVSIHTQIGNLKREHNIVIATPGRLKDLENRKYISLQEYGTIVLDEVDRMLDMGFIHDIKQIITLLPQKRQSLFFSATLPKQISDIARMFLTEPLTISVDAQSTAPMVDQDIIKVNGRSKHEVLIEVLNREGYEKVIVFGRTKWGTEKIARFLGKNGFRVAAIHGNKKQNQRQRALREFREGTVTILVATDVAARGLDIDNVTHVINFDEPATYEDYIHRIGRTGRANKKGSALTFLE
jgi:superfamily II DNA/RNA helicase